MLSRCTAYGLGLCCALTAGCSGLDARLVPLADRQCGKDANINGFRYYLPRPYLLVPQRLDVAVQHIPVVLVANSADPQHPNLMGLDERGQVCYYNCAGTPISRPETLTPDCQACSFYFAGSSGPALDNVDSSEKPAELPPPHKEPSPQPTGASAKFNGIAHPLGASGSKPSANGEVKPSVVGRETATPLQLLRIVYLPDFEQQMAVRPSNFLAKHEFAFTFHDGWQLTAVNSACDAAEVPVQLLAAIRKSVNPFVAGSAGTNSRMKWPFSSPSTAGKIQVWIRRTRFVAPGLYRLDKPAPTTLASPSCPTLLSALGVPVECETVVEVVR